VPAAIVAKLKPIETKIASGQITPPDTVK